MTTGPGRGGAPRARMAAGMAAALVAAMAAIAALTSGGGACYDPHIKSGGLRCAAASTGKRCPDGFTCMGMRCANASIRTRALANDRGRPLISAPTASALNSRWRLIAN